MSNSPTFWINGTTSNNTGNQGKKNIIQEEKGIIREEENIFQKMKTEQQRSDRSSDRSSDQSGDRPRDRSSNQPRDISGDKPRDWRGERRETWWRNDQPGRKDRFKKKFKGRRNQRVGGPPPQINIPSINAPPINTYKKNNEEKITVKNITNQYSKLLDNLKYLDSTKNDLYTKINNGVPTADLQTMKDLVVKLYRYIKDVNESFSLSPQDRSQRINELVQKLKSNKEFNEKLAVVVALQRVNKLNKKNYTQVMKNNSNQKNLANSLSNILGENVSNVESLLKGNNKPTVGNNRSIAGNNRSIAGNNRSVAGNNRSVAGNNRSVANNNKPSVNKPAGNNRSTGNNKPAGNNKPVGNNKPANNKNNSSWF